MSQFFFADRRTTGRSAQVDFSTLVSVIHGTSIVSMADSDQFMEFGLSEKLQLRIEATDHGTLRAVVYSTLNSDDTAPVRLQVIAEDEEPEAALVETRLRSIRQLYAILYLLNEGRAEELAAVVDGDSQVDIEQQLLNEEERLYLEAAGPGSWWLTVFSVIKNTASRTALNTLSLVFGEGRSMLIERVRAGTSSEQEDARAKAIANDWARALGAIEIATAWDKIENPDTKDMIRQLLLSNAEILDPKASPILLESSGPSYKGG